MFIILECPFVIIIIKRYDVIAYVFITSVYIFKSLRKISGIVIDVAFGAFFGALSAIFSAQLASLMTDDPVVIEFAQQKMILISSTYFIFGINNICDAALKGMGKPVVSTVTTFLFMCVLRFVWVYLIFPLFPDSLTFLYLVWPVGWILCIATELCFYFPTVKKLKRLYGTAPATNT